MAQYDCIASYLQQFEDDPSDKAADRLCEQLVSCFFEDDFIDRDYLVTLDRHGMTGRKAWCANIEALPLDAVIAVLTLMHRAERAMYDPSDKTPLLRSIEDGYGLRILRRIAELNGSWQRPNVVTFYHEYDKDGYLSNWYDAPFSFAGTSFPTSEHWMMWHKAQLFGDVASAEKILGTANPSVAKHLGKKVKPFDPGVWDEVSRPIMAVGLRQKFVQNERLANELLSTGSAALAEASPIDPIWGLGISRDDPRTSDPLKWHGKNLLGITLMGVRADLRALATTCGRMEWDTDVLRNSHVWRMSLLELARVPSTRAAALMYAQMACQAAPGAFHGTKGVLKKVNGPIGKIDEQMRLNMGCGLPVVGWPELLDELALQVTLGRV